MNTPPPIGGFGSSLNDTAAKIRELIDLDRASADEIRRWTLVGIVDLHTRMGQIEQAVKRQEENHFANQRLMLAIGALAWIALIVASVAMARAI